MDKDEIKKIVMDAIDSGAIQYTLETCNTGDCTLKLGPICFKREIPPPPLDPNAKKYVILRGNETEKEREHIKKRLGFHNLNRLYSRSISLSKKMMLHRNLPNRLTMQRSLMILTQKSKHLKKK